MQSYKSICIYTAYPLPAGSPPADTISLKFHCYFFGHKLICITWPALNIFFFLVYNLYSIPLLTADVFSSSNLIYTSLTNLYISYFIFYLFFTLYLLSSIITAALLYFCKTYTFPAGFTPARSFYMQEEPILM